MIGLTIQIGFLVGILGYFGMRIVEELQGIKEALRERNDGEEATNE